MSDPRSLLERESRRFIQENGAFERLARRRDRKRRNHRIAAAVVGIAVFVAAVWVVRDVTSLDRSETTVPAASGTTAPTQSGGADTGPADTGPADTGPADTGPTAWDGYGIPPKETALSTPVEGQPILVQGYGGEELLGKQVKRCPSGCRKWYHTHLVVYADGRVLWWNDLRGVGGVGGPAGGDYVLERHLTPKGVDLVRSGVDPAHVPDSAWADAQARPYAPPQYAVCFEPNHGALPSNWPFGRAIDLLPRPARAALGGSHADMLHPECLVVSTKDARALHDILSETGLDPAADLGGVSPGATVGAWLLRDAILGEDVGIYLHPLWPDGDWHQVWGA